MNKYRLRKPVNCTAPSSTSSSTSFVEIFSQRHSREWKRWRSTSTRCSGSTRNTAPYSITSSDSTRRLASSRLIYLRVRDYFHFIIDSFVRWSSTPDSPFAICYLQADNHCPTLQIHCLSLFSPPSISDKRPNR